MLSIEIFYPRSIKYIYLFLVIKENYMVLIFYTENSIFNLIYFKYVSRKDLYTFQSSNICVAPRKFAVYLLNYMALFTL